jgi:predicted dehydrogenase
MKQAIHWGILGNAKIAREHLAPAIHQSKSGVLSALASRSPEAAAAWKEQYPGITVHDSYEALLGDPEIDAVYIPLPNHLHIPWTIKAIEAGKHVLCEKPIALKAEDIDQLIRMRDASGLVVAEAFMVVHHPQWHRVKEIIASGEIGALKMVQGAFSFNNGAETDNIRNREDTGGGALRDIGVYPSVTTRFVTGQEPRTIHSVIGWEKGIDTDARVHAQFPGFSLDFYCSMRLGLRQQMNFHGTDGFITVDSPFNAGLYDGETLRVRFSDRTERVERFAGERQYLLQIEAFNRSVLTGEDFPCSLEFSKGNQKMIDMIYSAEMES